MAEGDLDGNGEYLWMVWARIWWMGGSSDFEEVREDIR